MFIQRRRSILLKEPKKKKTEDARKLHTHTKLMDLKCLFCGLIVSKTCLTRFRLWIKTFAARDIYCIISIYCLDISFCRRVWEKYPAFLTIDAGDIAENQFDTYCQLNSCTKCCISPKSFVWANQKEKKKKDAPLNWQSKMAARLFAILIIHLRLTWIQVKHIF